MSDPSLPVSGVPKSRSGTKAGGVDQRKASPDLKTHVMRYLVIFQGDFSSTIDV